MIRLSTIGTRTNMRIHMHNMQMIVEQGNNTAMDDPRPHDE
jgi:hypothetical protein